MAMARAPLQPTPLALSARERQSWQRILDAIPFYVLLIDENHQIIAFNEAMRREFCVDEPHGAYCPRLVHGSDEPFPGCPLETVVNGQVGVEIELFDDSTRRWMMSAVYPTTLLTEEGRPVYLHFARDISQEKQASLDLEQSLEHHKALGTLLQQLRTASSPEQTLEFLLDLVLNLSWMDATCGAAAFVRRGPELQLAVCRNLGELVRKRCDRVPLGECLCGRAALGQIPLIQSADMRFEALRVSHEDTSHGHAVFPLTYEGRALGVVNFYVRPGCELEASRRLFLDAAVGVAAAALAEQLSRVAAREAREQAAALERKLLERVLASQEEERKRVARDLHDDLGQSLSALLLEVKSMPADAPTHTIRDQMERAVLELVEKVHRLAWDLRPSVLDDYGLDSALERHVANVEQRAGLPIDYRFACPDDADPRLPPSIELVLYRVTQEALNNVVRHAKAKRASLVVLRQREAVTLLVEDDGCGFEPTLVKSTESSGLGLTSIRERVALIKGKLSIDSDPRNGTSLRVWIPVDGLRLPTKRDASGGATGER